MVTEGRLTEKLFRIVVLSKKFAGSCDGLKRNGEDFLVAKRGRGRLILRRHHLSTYLYSGVDCSGTRSEHWDVFSAACVPSYSSCQSLYIITRGYLQVNGYS